MRVSQKSKLQKQTNRLFPLLINIEDIDVKYNAVFRLVDVRNTEDCHLQIIKCLFMLFRQTRLLPLKN